LPGTIVGKRLPLAAIVRMPIELRHVEKPASFPCLQQMVSELVRRYLCGSGDRAQWNAFIRKADGHLCKPWFRPQAG
jgi:hypothetical protein